MVEKGRNYNNISKSELWIKSKRFGNFNTHTTLKTLWENNKAEAVPQGLLFNKAGFY